MIGTTLAKRKKYRHYYKIAVAILYVITTAPISLAAYGSQIQWTPGGILEHTSPGDSVDITAEFTIMDSSPSFKYKTKVKIPRKLRRFISVSPKKLKNVSSGQAYPLIINLKVPSDATPGIYKGKLKLVAKPYKTPKKRWLKWIFRRRRPKLASTLPIKLIVTNQKADLTVKNANNTPTRLSQGSDGKVYVTDAKSGSVFIYSSNLNILGEIKGLDRPLGVAVDVQGMIYVGSNGRDNIEIYHPNGFLQGSVGDGMIQMPNDLAFDNGGNLYVADSLSHTIKVFDISGQWLRDIGSPGSGDGQLDFPVALSIDYGNETGELYVADQGHAAIQVFNLAGNFLRSFGGKIDAFSSDWEGKFTRIQSLAHDSSGRLHAVDCYMNKIQMLDPVTGEFLGAYGGFGEIAGALNLPLDLLFINDDQVAVTNAGNHRVEVIESAP